MQFLLDYFHSLLISIVTFMSERTWVHLLIQSIYERHAATLHNLEFIVSFHFTRN